jgi:TolB protein
MLSRFLAYCSLLVTLLCVLIADAYAKVYLDVTSPGMRKLPIAVQEFIGGKEISDIIAEDLNFTGLFQCVEAAAHMERPDQAFNPGSWRGTGVELVVKGRVQSPLKVTVSAYDVTEGREVLAKEYTGSKELLRPLAHAIANDLYRLLTGEQGIFRSRLAFVSEKSGRKELALSDWDGQRAYGSAITAGILLTPRWSTDGGRLLYSAERQREWGIYLIDLKTMKERNIVLLKGLNLSGNFFPGDREFVFTSTREGNSDIYVADTGTLKGTKLISSPWIDVSPSVSPDGRQVLFVSNRSGSPQIYLCDRHGDNVRRLTFQGSYNTSPVWSPKGDRIAFSGLAGGKHQIFVMKLDGTSLVQLTDRGNNEEPTFSPDGRYIAFTSDRDGTKGIYLTRIDGDGQRRVSPRGVRATSPSWSPL